MAARSVHVMRMGLEPPVRPDVRLELLRDIEKQLAAHDHPDIELIALVRELVLEAESKLRE